MKLLRYGPKGQEKPGCLDHQGNLRDLSGVVADFGGDTVSLDSLAQLSALDPRTLPLVAQPVRIGAPMSHIPNFYCIGLNYAAHAAETGAEKPKEPLVFSKATSSLAGPEDTIIIPRGATRTDWEVELGIVIGKPALYVDEADALDYVAGYCAVNDVSERDFQKNRGGQWIKGKSAPGFGKIGPWLVTKDEVPDPQALRLQLSVNGENRQDSTTADMIFTVAQIVSYMSHFMELVPGDVIATGTPSGVGAGMSPQRFLQPGDIVALEVEGLGQQKADVIAAV
ncbi:fumarylacetoacetate hydrolase family protein [Roseinatronobacter alkalisoli]|uniref:Fumarylacetoacetate hydrolase family protein n=1 Tax=Roseinatronobacter alkalisoli TaxID=3028235 RepID=A0ABT5T5V3_9RHOB|nr:fumarylacetoacetate hydrolase family protein [Roseinatronobacter sp. HJB301]MDD7970485.1 fumarylacetoacetate hydrolase family protein [Roseinatronobacter sp. HJB301]